MDKQFGRVIEFHVGGGVIRNSEVEIHFDVPFDDNLEPNESKVILHNLSDSTINQIRKFEKAVLNAGYEGAVGTVWEGYIYDHDTKWNDVDKETTFYVHDSENPGNKTVKSISYAKNTKADTIIRDLAKKYVLSIAIDRKSTRLNS